MKDLKQLANMPLNHDPAILITISPVLDHLENSISPKSTPEAVAYFRLREIKMDVI